MNRNFRAFLYVLCIIQAIFAVLFVMQTPFAVSFWPTAVITPLSLIFVGSICAAAAVSTFWVLYAREDAALAGIALDYMVILGPIGVFSIQIAGGSTSLLAFGAGCIGGSIFGLWMFGMSWRLPFHDQRPMPRLVYWSFVVFVVALVFVGTSLATQTPNVLPWAVTPELSVLFGWMFLGAAAYFAYGLYRPRWHNAAGQLAGFLMYDLVLIVPFMQRLGSLPEQFVVSQLIYLGVVVYSAALALYYLFVNPATRVFGARQLATA
jgi:hypothetical protein